MSSMLKNATNSPKMYSRRENREKFSADSLPDDLKAESSSTSSSEPQSAQSYQTVTEENSQSREHIPIEV
jgi:hypothetical protein